jgi:tRNA-dihydrouridine synthase C
MTHVTPRSAALRMTGRDASRELVFPTPLLLAPMEGVTDRTFRAAVLDLGGAGGACTEFLRISVAPIPARVIRRELGAPRTDAPVGVQIMSPGLEHLAATVVNAERAGAAWIDLNFGCPVARVCGKGAGSALLADPPLLERIVSAAVAATQLPVSAKVRVGIEDTSRLTEVVDAAASGGAAMLTVHGRRRVDSYNDPANWDWIALAVARWRERARGPICGNGSVGSATDARRMMLETGCDLVMVGRGAIADPFLFREFAGSPPADAAEAAAFALRYADSIQPDAAAHHRLGRIKQLVRWYRAGGLFDGREDERLRLLRAPDGATIRAFFERFLPSPATL